MKRVPDIAAEIMTTEGDAEGFVSWHSFRFEVFDLPAFDSGDDVERADVVRAVAIHEGADAMVQFARTKMHDGRATREDVKAVNEQLSRMAEALAAAAAMLRDGDWWIDNETGLIGAAAYTFILQAADMRCRQATD